MGIDCSKKASLPSLEVTLGGKAFTLTADDYVLSVSGQCLFAFIGLDVPPPRGPCGSWVMSSCASITVSLTMATRRCALLQLQSAPAKSKKRLRSSYKA